MCVDCDHLRNCQIEIVCMCLNESSILHVHRDHDVDLSIVVNSLINISKVG